MSWTRVSLLTNVTRDPAEIVTVRGDTAFPEMVIVAPPGVGVGVGVGDGAGAGAGDGEDGVELELPPHAVAARSRNAQSTNRRIHT